MKHDTLQHFPSEDPAMAFAIQEAQRTLPEFFAQYQNPNPRQQYFLVKVAFEHAGEVEHVWIANVDPSVYPLTGVVANEPKLLNLKFLQSTSFYADRITDWMIVEDGYMVGGFTNQVAFDRMSPEERQAHLASIPYKMRHKPDAS